MKILSLLATAAVAQGPPVVPSRSPTCQETLIDETPFYQRGAVDPIYPATCIARSLESYQVKVKVECSFEKIKAMPEDASTMLLTSSSSLTVRARNSDFMNPHYMIILSGFIDLEEEYVKYDFDGTEVTNDNILYMYENQCTEGGFMEIEVDQWFQDGRYFRIMKIDGVTRLVVISAIISDFREGPAIRWYTDATGFVFSSIAIKDFSIATFFPSVVPSRSPTCQEILIDETPFYQPISPADPIVPAICIATSDIGYQVKIKVECNFAKIRAMPEETYIYLISGIPSFSVSARNHSRPFYTINTLGFYATEAEYTYNAFDGTQQHKAYLHLYENQCTEGGFIDIEFDQWLEDGRYFKILKIDGVTRVVVTLPNGNSIHDEKYAGKAIRWTKGASSDGIVYSSIAIKDFSIATFGPPVVPSRSPTCQETLIDETPFYQRIPSTDPIYPATCIAMRLESYQAKIKLECNFAKIRAMPEKETTMLFTGFPSFYVSARNWTTPYYRILLFSFNGLEEEYTYYSFDGSYQTRSYFHLYENECTEGGFMDIEIDQWLQDGRYFKIMKIDGVTRLATSSIGSNYQEELAVDWYTGLTQADDYVMSTLGIKDFSIATFVEPTTTTTTTSTTPTTTATTTTTTSTTTTTPSTGFKNWGIDFSFRCKDNTNDPEEDILSVGDKIRILRPPYDRAYRIVMSKMSENTNVAKELFNPYPSHSHIGNQTTMDPFYQSWLCKDRNNRWMNVRFEQKFCPGTGLYTKSLYYGCLERMRYIDTVPTVLDNPQISFGGQGSLPVEGKPIVRWFNVEELQDGCGVFPNDVQPTGCVKNGQSYEYGHAQWKGATGASDVCFCYPGGRYKCKKAFLGGRSCWNID